MKVYPEQGESDRDDRAPKLQSNTEVISFGVVEDKGSIEQAGRGCGFLTCWSLIGNVTNGSDREIGRVLEGRCHFKLVPWASLVRPIGTICIGTSFLGADGIFRVAWFSREDERVYFTIADFYKKIPMIIDEAAYYPDVNMDLTFVDGTLVATVRMDRCILCVFANGREVQTITLVAGLLPPGLLIATWGKMRASVSDVFRWRNLWHDGVLGPPSFKTGWSIHSIYSIVYTCTVVTMQGRVKKFKTNAKPNLQRPKVCFFGAFCIVLYLQCYCPIQCPTLS